jgi:hypothetical protein
MELLQILNAPFFSVIRVGFILLGLLLFLYSVVLFSSSLTAAPFENPILKIGPKTRKEMRMHFVFSILIFIFSLTFLATGAFLPFLRLQLFKIFNT